MSEWCSKVLLLFFICQTDGRHVEWLIQQLLICSQIKLSVNNQLNFHLFLTQIYHETSEDIYRKLGKTKCLATSDSSCWNVSSHSVYSWIKIRSRYLLPQHSSRAPILKSFPWNCFCGWENIFYIRQNYTHLPACFMLFHVHTSDSLNYSVTEAKLSQYDL